MRTHDEINTWRLQADQSARLMTRARELVADTDEGFPFPDIRAVDLAIRLIAPGPKAGAVSASECHEITEAVIAAYDRDTFPVMARTTITELTNQLEATATELALLQQRVQDQDEELRAHAARGWRQLMLAHAPGSCEDAHMQEVVRTACLEILRDTPS